MLVKVSRFIVDEIFGSLPLQQVTLSSGSLVIMYLLSAVRIQLFSLIGALLANAVGDLPSVFLGLQVSGINDHLSVYHGRKLRLVLHVEAKP